MKDSRTTVKVPRDARRALRYAAAIHDRTQQDLMAFAAELLMNVPEGALDDLRRYVELLADEPAALEQMRQILAARS